MSETELRRLRDAAARRKHYESAFLASEYRLLPAEYLSWVYEVAHVGYNGVFRADDQFVDSGEPESHAPKHEPRALRLLREEGNFLVAKRVPLLRNALDEIVGEAAA